MQTTPGVDTMLDAVGPRLRELRGRRQLTLAAVAETTGLSVSTLSRLESGRRRPTLDLLIPLAQVYRVALDDIVGAPPTGDPRIHLTPIRRDGMVFVPLTLAGAPVQAFKVVLPGRRPDAPAKRATHGGYEWLYVLKGTIRLTVGDEVTVLAEGEAAEFDTRRPHSITSATARAAEMLTLFSPDGAQIHVRD
ncbi:helix-turn-helix domain-containing protein [Catenuloplanes indicus]|uniref:Transcriptional regulator with XRE-family HTH domain n=1 Tax=Catenuloplanes indicus TaxID=137267 RepID=A0AAE3VTC6_9ACTN|nr:XRE family transcriptional regulator [Catenuloplanes indicus]MDQ0363928.1 transcriptional regulator with XRE-family HTH domain [Catenuloplanes indicus]